MNAIALVVILLIGGGLLAFVSLAIGSLESQLQKSSDTKPAINLPEA